MTKKLMKAFIVSAFRADHYLFFFCPLCFFDIPKTFPGKNSCRPLLPGKYRRPGLVNKLTMCAVHQLAKKSLFCLLMATADGCESSNFKSWTPISGGVK